MKRLLQLFFPKLCIGCSGVLINEEDLLCLSCLKEIKYNNFNNQFLLQKLSFIQAVQAVHFLIYYSKENYVTANVFHQLKYKNQEYIGKYLAQLTIERIADHDLFSQIDEIICVPISKNKLKKRGYNQLHLYCKTLSEYLNIPFNKTILERETSSKSQARKNKIERETSKEVYFTPVFSEKDYNKHFLLIDDIITTGTTIGLACEAVSQIPGVKISVFCIAHSE